MIEEVDQLQRTRITDVAGSLAELESTVSALQTQVLRGREAHNRLRSLLDASAAIGGELDLELLLERVVNVATDLVRARYGALGVLQPDGRLERMIQTDESRGDEFSIEWHATARGSDSNVAGVTAPLSARPAAGTFAATPDADVSRHSSLRIPIRFGDEEIAQLYLTDRRNGTFTPLDEQLVSEFAVAAGIAIDNARRFEETRRKQRLSAALSDVASTLLSAGADDVLGTITSKVAGLLPATLVAIIVPGPCESEMRIAAAEGLGSEDAVGDVFPAQDSVAAEAVATGRVITSPGGHSMRSARGVMEFGAIMAVPLVVSGRPIGALCIARGPGGMAFSRAERDTVTEFALQAGLAVALVWARLDRARIEVIEDHARIARDLHDNVIQRLFATGLGLQALAAEDPAHAEAIDAHTLEIDAAIADIRSAVFLRTSTPPSDAKRVRHRVLDVLVQLTPALGSSPRVAFSGHSNTVIPRQLADDIVAVVRESLMNIAKHARATTSEVDVRLGDTSVSIMVSDDGIGIGHEVTRSSGTRNLARRAERYGGQFILEPRSPHGTSARWNVHFAADGDK